jgi:lambda family phage minor tail protein L
MTATKLYADIQTLEPGEWTELFTLDGTKIGAPVENFHGYTQVGPIVWQGVSFNPWPIQAEGFALDSSQTPTPTLTASNVNGLMTALCLAYQDMVGAKLIRLRTLGKYLDAVNFPGGNPTADPDQGNPPDIWFIQRRSNETSEAIQWELSSALDFNNRQLPGRQIQPICGWLQRGGYRGKYCGYNGPPVAKADDTPTSDPAQDMCGGRIVSCKDRFGENAELPHGGFPAASLIKS